MHTIALALVWSVLTNTVPLARAASPTSCELLFTDIRRFVADARVESPAAWSAYRPRLRPIVDAFVRDGYRAPFVARQLAALAFVRDHVNLRLFDLYGADFAAFLDPARPDEADVIARVRGGRETLGGLFFTTERRGRPTFVIAVDPSSRALPFTDAVIEEILHLRMRLVHARLLPEDVDPHAPESGLPFILTTAGAPLSHLLDEFAAKEALHVHGRGRTRDREALLRDLRREPELRPAIGVVGYAHLCLLLAVAAERTGTGWRTVKLADVLRLAFAAEAPELLAAFRGVDDAALADLLRVTTDIPYTPADQISDASGGG